MKKFKKFKLTIIMVMIMVIGVSIGMSVQVSCLEDPPLWGNTNKSKMYRK